MDIDPLAVQAKLRIVEREATSAVLNGATDEEVNAAVERGKAAARSILARQGVILHPAAGAAPQPPAQPVPLRHTEAAPGWQSFLGNRDAA